MTKPKPRPPSTKLFGQQGLLLESEEKEDVGKVIGLKLPEDLIVNTRKKLFRTNLSLQEFIGFLMFKLTLDDNRMLQLLSEATEFSKKGSSKPRRQKKASKITSDDLYDFFEEVDKKNF